MEWEKQETMRLLQGRPGTMYQESNEQDRKVYRDWLKSLLRLGVTEVTFVKSDGSLRTMKATLDPALVPNPTVSFSTMVEERKKPEPNNDVCKVWDSEAQAWRSFRYDRIKSISINLS